MKEALSGGMDRALVSGIELSLFTLGWWEKGLVQFLSPTSSGRYRSGRVWGFVRSRQTFVLGSHWRRMAMGSMVTVVSAHDDERRHRPQQ